MRSFSLLVPMVFATFALAQSPQSFNYQGVARDAVGEPLSAQAIGVEFRLRSGSALGPVAYSETHGATTDMFGLFTLHVGEGAPGTGTFSAIDWRSGPYFLEIGLDLSASGSYTSFGTQQLLSVPYALHAGSSGDLPLGTEVGQIMHWDGGAWVADSGLYVHDKRFGIGIQEPVYPLGLKAKGGKLFSVTAEVQPVGESPNKWGVSIANEGTDSAGLSIDELTANGEESRLFIQHGTGNVGIGARRFSGKYHVQGLTHRGSVGIGIRNTEAIENDGWSLAHLHDSIAQRSGSFTIVEREGVLESERVIIRAGGNVGINELIPDTRLHVSLPVSDPSSALDLIEGTGIVTIGPITDNIVADYRGIQARHGEYAPGGSTLSLSTAPLNLQRLGGDILIHGDDAVLSDQVIVSSDGKIGVGTITPNEKLEVNGAIVIGNTSTASPAPGSIRFNGSEFEAWKAGDWAIFDGTLWGKVDNTDNIYFNTGTAPRVGIGTDTPTAALHVSEDEATTGSSTAVVIESHATTASNSAANTRIGLQVSTSGEWSSNAGAKSATLVATATPGGSSPPHLNAAAVLGGNVVIGDLTVDQVVGTGGSNVLAIQNGTPPADGLSGGPGSNGAIQFYSADLSGVSTIHVMNGNGDVIKLYKEAPITPAQNLPVDGIYDPSEAIVIENMRTRITELENVLKNLGLLTP